MAGPRSKCFGEVCEVLSSVFAPLPVAATVCDKGNRGRKKIRIAVLIMALLISRYCCKFLVSEGLECLMCWRN